MKILNPIFKWSHTVFHKVNQGIFLTNKKLKSKRHHPEEFESVIISEYENNVYKGIDTILHGFFTNEPKYLGQFSSLEETLQNAIFFYTIGDHAMSVEKQSLNYASQYTLKIPLIKNDDIVQKYDLNFYSYIEKLMNLNKLLSKKILFLKKTRKKHP